MATQKKVIGFEARRTSFFDRVPLRGYQLKSHSTDDSLGNFILQGEDIGQVAINSDVARRCCSVCAIRFD